MTHSLSMTAADRPPAMYRSATLATVVSSTSMNVGTTTATATNQGLIAGRPAEETGRVALLMVCARGRARDRCGAGSEARGTLRQVVRRLQDFPGVRPRGRFLEVHVGGAGQA